MNSSPLQQMLPQLWALSCRALLIPTWGASYESLHCGQAGDICCLQDQQGSPFLKHPVYPKATGRISTRNQGNPTALTSPFLPRHQNPPKPMAYGIQDPPAVRSHSLCDSGGGSFDILLFQGIPEKICFHFFQRGLDDNWSCPRHPNLAKWYIPPYQMCLLCNSRLVLLRKIVT